VLNACRILTSALLSARRAAAAAAAAAAGGAAAAAAAAPAGADDLTPLLIYATIQAAPPALASNLAYIERFRGGPRLSGEAHYYFVQLSGAAAFVETLDAGSLKCDPGACRAAPRRAARTDARSATHRPALQRTPALLLLR